jgi:acetylornithine deacetylase
MDPLNVVAFARELIDIDSTTGLEPRAGVWLAEALRRMGYTVVEQPVAGDRVNILATLDPPVVVLSTHYDCVPPFFPSEIRGGRLHGRGACDAKGTLAAQVAAAAQMRADGERRVGLLFVVGEERGSDGAIAANAQPAGSKFLVNGEPTDSRLATATRGVLRVKLRATGRAAHSAAPEQGESAIDKLHDAVFMLRSVELPADDVMGRTFYSIGLIEGGLAPNVIPSHASAELLFRISRPADEVLERLRVIEPLVTVEEVLRVPPVHLRAFGDIGLETAAFPFTTDIPLLDRWGTPLLFGPGSFLVAHTEDEYVEIGELEAAAGKYVAITRACLAEAGAV